MSNSLLPRSIRRFAFDRTPSIFAGISSCPADQAAEGTGLRFRSARAGSAQFPGIGGHGDGGVEPVPGIHQITDPAVGAVALGGEPVEQLRRHLIGLDDDGANAYSAAKSAEWSLTNGIRLELAGQGTTVTGLHLASTHTDMMAGWDVEKNDPADVVRAALDGLEVGRIEILADEGSAQIKAGLSADPSVLYPQIGSSA